MPRIDTVVTNVGYGKQDLEALRDVFAPAEFIHARTRDELLAAAARADVAIVRGDLERAFLAAPRLRWVHCDKAGLDGSAWPEVFERGLLVTSSAGRSGAALAEHVMFFMLSLAYDANAFQAAQRRRSWTVPGVEGLRALSGQTVGILGLGHIGSAVAQRCAVFGMRVLGYRRRDIAPPPGVDRVYCVERGEGLGAILAESDFLVLALPLSDSTHGIVGRTELGLMKRSAFLINIARGALTDEAALAEALAAGRLAGAGLDVFANEPLPRNSPFWRTPHTIITPHVTPRLADRTLRSIAIIAENARRYREGEPMLNLLTPPDVYSRAAGRLPATAGQSPPRSFKRISRAVWRRLPFRG